MAEDLLLNDQVGINDQTFQRGHFLVRSSLVEVPSMSAAALSLLALAIAVAARKREPG